MWHFEVIGDSKKRIIKQFFFYDNVAKWPIGIILHIVVLFVGGAVMKMAGLEVRGFASSNSFRVVKSVSTQRYNQRKRGGRGQPEGTNR